MFTILHHVVRFLGKQNQILRSACKAFIEECSQNNCERKGRGWGRRTELQEKMKGNALAWNQLVSEGALELSWLFRVVLATGLSTSNQPVIGCSHLRENPEPCLGSSLLLRAFLG